MLESATIRTCYERAKQQLLDQRVPQGHWVGELSTSALSTATAVSALALATRHTSKEVTGADRRLITRGVAYLLDHQNADGGWGDTELSHSNIATTMLCVAALTLTGDADRHPSVLGPAREYIERQGGITGLRRRYGKDKTFAVPILTNYALAGLVPWREVSPMPFELAVLPQKFYKFVKLPVVSYAIPALVAIGQAKFYHTPPWNPITRVVRSLARGKSLTVLDRMQPESGGYLEAVPLTSFVVMSLASIGHADDPVTREGLRFIRDSVRRDGSWPIDTNLATWNTTLSLNALAAAGDDVGEHDILDWLLSCQFREVHPFTGADPGGWGWTDLPGSVPDADDTPGALLALAAYDASPNLKPGQQANLREAAALGVDWLLNLQNSDGGWPTFCKGWGTQPFDRSGADLTAHAIRALHRWHGIQPSPRTPAAIERGFAYLARQQQPSGAWLPLWFGNQDQEGEDNPIYGTAKV
ncbi:MAG: prenyltransferase/squalene oxidase repeat-containing protein, partial [Pirellulaceae bacterium]